MIVRNGEGCVISAFRVVRSDDGARIAALLAALRADALRPGVADAIRVLADLSTSSAADAVHALEDLATPAAAEAARALKSSAPPAAALRRLAARWGTGGTR